MIQRRLISRLTAVSILVLLLAILGLGLVRPVVSFWLDQRDRRAEAERLLVGYSRIAAARELYQRQLTEIRARPVDPSRLVEGGTSALASAALQALVKRVIETPGGRIVSSVNLPDIGEAGFERVGLRFDFSAPLSALQRMLHELEGGSPALFIDNLDIRAPESLPGDSSVPAEAVLTVRWDVFGYRRGAAP